MSDWPVVQGPHLFTITACSLESCGPHIQTELLAGNNLGNAALTANRILYVPFWLDTPATAYQMFWVNGVVAANHVDMGIYNRDGVWLVNAGSTVIGGSNNAPQLLDITDTPLSPGEYYMAFWIDSATPTIKIWSIAGRFLASMGCFETLSATGGLPTSTATFANCTVTDIPYIGIALRALI